MQEHVRLEDDGAVEALAADEALMRPGQLRFSCNEQPLLSLSQFPGAEKWKLGGGQGNVRVRRVHAFGVLRRRARVTFTVRNQGTINGNFSILSEKGKSETRPDKRSQKGHVELQMLEKEENARKERVPATL